MQHALERFPVSGLVVSVSNPDGPTDQMRVTIQATYADRSTSLFEGVQPLNFERVRPYDVTTSPGCAAAPYLTATGIRWIVDSDLVTTSCED